MADGMRGMSIPVVGNEVVFEKLLYSSFHQLILPCRWHFAFPASLGEGAGGRVDEYGQVRYNSAVIPWLA